MEGDLGGVPTWPQVGQNWGIRVRKPNGGGGKREHEYSQGVEKRGLEKSARKSVGGGGEIGKRAAGGRRTEKLG